MRFRSVFARILTPVISLTGGLLTLFLFRRGIGFAPISLGIAITAWIAGGLFARYFATSNKSGDDTPPTSYRVARFLSKSVAVGLYQNVLFFVLPIWYGSAEFYSPNIVFPIVLSALALFACFDDHFTQWVISHRTRRTIANAVLLFSVSVPAAALQHIVTLRIGAALCAAVAGFVAVLFGGPRAVPSRRSVAFAPLAAAPLGICFYFAFYLLPPVPVQCVTKAASTSADARQLSNVSEVFEHNVEKVFVHFAVAAPDGFRQKIRFQWYSGGEKLGRPLPSAIIGGRKRGFRTRTFRSAPRPGRYRVDLETQDGQLIARARFRVK
jgi:hypothetical protein